MGNMQTIMEININKATSGNDIRVPLTDSINSGILNGIFPDELKLAGKTPLYEKSDPEDKKITH